MRVLGPYMGAVCPKCRKPVKEIADKTLASVKTIQKKRWGQDLCNACASEYLK